MGQIKIWIDKSFQDLQEKLTTLNQQPNPAIQKKNFDFSLFFFTFFNRLNIILSGGEKYGLIGNFKTIKKN